MVNSPNSTVYQAGRDIVIGKPPAPPAIAISTVVIESRVTCTAKAGVELPPEKVEIGPWWGGDAELRGPAGPITFKISSPVLFLRQSADRIVVVNRFYLPEDSPLRGRPVAALATYDDLILPVTTVVNTYSAALDHITLLEVSIRVGNEDPAYGSYRYDVPFEQGKGSLQFTVPLKPLLHAPAN